MLIFPLKKEWYEKIWSGEKTIEYREVKPYWTNRFVKIFAGFKDWILGLFRKQTLEECLENILRVPLSYAPFYTKTPCKLRLGYTKQYMSAMIVKVEIVDGKDTDLHIDKPVYAIHLADVKEIEG